MEIPYEGAENALKVYIAVSNQFSNLGLDPHFPTNLADLNSAGSNNSNILIFESIQSLVQFLGEIKLTTGEKWDYALIKQLYFIDSKFYFVNKLNKFGSTEQVYLSSCVPKIPEKSTEDQEPLVISCKGGSRVELEFRNGTALRIDGTPYWAQINQRNPSQIDLNLIYPLSLDTPSRWSTLKQLKAIELPESLSTYLIRGVQGTKDSLVIQYASDDGLGSINRFKDAAAIYIDLRTKNDMAKPYDYSLNTKYSGSIFSQIIINQVDSDKFEISRDSSAWISFLENTSSLSDDNETILELTVTDEQGKTTSTKAGFQISKNHDDLKLKSKPDLEYSMYPNSW